MTIFWILLGSAYGLFWFFKQISASLKTVSDYKAEYNSKMKPYFISMSVFIIVLVAFRAETIGRDTSTYKFLYEGCKGLEFSYILSPSVKEKAFVFLEILFNKLGLTFFHFNLAYAIFNVSVISYLIYRYSETPWFSYIIYMCFELFTLLFSMMRQITAMSIIILAVLNDEDNGIKSFLKFFILTYIAAMFHASAWVAILMWFIKRIKYNNVIGLIMIATMAFTYIFKGVISSWAFALAGDIYNKYERYAAIGVGNEGLKLYLMLIASLIFTVIVPAFLSEKKNAFAFFCMCVMVIIFPAVQGGGALMRVYYYYYIFMIIYVPNMIADIKNESNLFFKGLIFALFMVVGLTLYQSKLEWFYVVPYRFFWQ